MREPMARRTSPGPSPSRWSGSSPRGPPPLDGSPTMTPRRRRGDAPVDPSCRPDKWAALPEEYTNRAVEHPKPAHQRARLRPVPSSCLRAHVRRRHRGCGLVGAAAVARVRGRPGPGRRRRLVGGPGRNCRRPAVFRRHHPWGGAAPLVGAVRGVGRGSGDLGRGRIGDGDRPVAGGGHERCEPVSVLGRRSAGHRGGTRVRPHRELLQPGALRRPQQAPVDPRDRATVPRRPVMRSTRPSNPRFSTSCCSTSRWHPL